MTNWEAYQKEKEACVSRCNPFLMHQEILPTDGKVTSNKDSCWHAIFGCRPAPFLPTETGRPGGVAQKNHYIGFVLACPPSHGVS